MLLAGAGAFLVVLVRDEKTLRVRRAQRGAPARRVRPRGRHPPSSGWKPRPSRLLRRRARRARLARVCMARRCRTPTRRIWRRPWRSAWSAAAASRASTTAHRRRRPPRSSWSGPSRCWRGPASPRAPPKGRQGRQVQGRWRGLRRGRRRRRSARATPARGGRERPLTRVGVRGPRPMARPHRRPSRWRPPRPERSPRPRAHRRRAPHPRRGGSRVRESRVRIKAETRRRTEDPDRLLERRRSNRPPVGGGRRARAAPRPSRRAVPPRGGTLSRGGGGGVTRGSEIAARAGDPSRDGALHPSVAAPAHPRPGRGYPRRDSPRRRRGGSR